MPAIDPDPTERIPVPPAPVAATRRVGALSARSLGALLVVAIAVLAVIVMRPGSSAGNAAASGEPTATPAAPAATVPGPSLESENPPTPQIAEPTLEATTEPTEKPTPKPPPNPTPTPN